MLAGLVHVTGVELLAMLQGLPPEYLALEVRVDEWLIPKSLALYTHEKEETANGPVRLLSLETDYTIPRGGGEDSDCE